MFVCMTRYEIRDDVTKSISESESAARVIYSQLEKALSYIRERYTAVGHVGRESA
jgi:hypothetical protein